MDCKIKPVNPKGNQSWIFIERTDAEAEAPILWPSDAKSWLIWKNLDAGTDWRQEEKGMTEDEMVEWHHGLNWAWVWEHTGSWRCTGKPGMQQSTGSQRVGHNLVTKLQSAFNAEKWTFRMSNIKIFIFTQEICIIKFLFEQILGDSAGQGSLVCCSPWSLKESDTT